VTFDLDPKSRAHPWVWAFLLTLGAYVVWVVLNLLAAPVPHPVYSP
jgi:hypothetical protein